MSDTRELFDRVLADEPPLRLTVEPVVAAGRRVRRRRRVAYATCTASLVAAAVVSVPLVLGDTASVTPLRPVASGSFDPALTPDQRRVAEAIVDGSPAGLTFEMEAGRWTGISFDGTVADGEGAGLLSVVPYLPDPPYKPCGGVPEPGTVGTVCSTETLRDGSVVRLTFVRDGERRLATGTLERPDGTGLVVRTANVTATPRSPLLGVTMPPAPITRADVVYTPDQLTRLLTALDPVFRALQA